MPFEWPSFFLVCSSTSVGRVFNAFTVPRIMGTERVTRQQNQDTVASCSRRKRDSSIEMQVSRYRQSSALHRARLPHNNILTYEISAFFQSHSFSWRPLTFRLPTSRAPATTLGCLQFLLPFQAPVYTYKAAQ